MQSVLADQRISKRPPKVRAVPVDVRTPSATRRAEPKTRRLMQAGIAVLGAVAVGASAMIALLGALGSRQAPVAASRPAAETEVSLGIGGLGPVRIPADIGLLGDEPTLDATAGRSETVDRTHRIQPGETLSEIAGLYGVDYWSLSFYNDLEFPDRVFVDQKLLIPSAANLQLFEGANDIAAMREGALDAWRRRLPRSVVVQATQQVQDGIVTARLRPSSDIHDSLSVRWDLGDGRHSFRKETYWTYDRPGTYVVSLTVSDGRNHARSNDLYIDVPYPTQVKVSRQHFATLQRATERFAITGDIVTVNGQRDVRAGGLRQVTADGRQLWRVDGPGFYAIESRLGSDTHQTYVFASPTETRHSDRTDINWYRTQFNTGAPSNCGPSVVSMGVGWAHGVYLPVADVRHAIGWRGDGGTSFRELMTQFRHQGVTTTITPVERPRDLMDIIDRDGIAVVLYQSGAISRAAATSGDNLFGRYYADAVGHYVIVKGYSTDGRHFVVYDPIPSNWSSNSARYADGVSMLGRNRYYAVGELFASLKTRNVLELRR